MNKSLEFYNQRREQHHTEWLRDLDAAEQELREAKTEKQIRAIQIRIKWIKHYITLTEKE